MARPQDARPHPGALGRPDRARRRVGTVAVVTGRPAATRSPSAASTTVPGLVVLGHYGCAALAGTASWPRRRPRPAVEQARAALPGVLRAAGAPDGTWVEDKGHAVAVHTRGTADPQAALDRLREPLRRARRPARPGRRSPAVMVLELRPPGVDKGSALTGLAGERAARSVLFAGDDLGDLPAFAAVAALRADGVPGCAVASASAESPQVAAAADLVVDGPRAWSRCSPRWPAGSASHD